MKKNTKKYDIVEIEGHTDNTGNISKNYQLSKARIEAVESFITEKLKVNSSKILLKAHGEFLANINSNVEKADIQYRKVIISLYATTKEPSTKIIKH